jgi:hypothetical protein
VLKPFPLPTRLQKVRQGETNYILLQNRVNQFGIAWRHAISSGVQIKVFRPYAQPGSFHAQRKFTSTKETIFFDASVSAISPGS